MRSFLVWWFGQLASLVPAPLRARLAGAGDAVLVSLDAEGRLAVSERRGDRVVPRGPGAAARPPSRGRPVLALPPAAATLRKTLRLPAAARFDLERVIGYELERETPFAADEVYWAFSVRARTGSDEKLDVELVVVPRLSVAPVIAAAEAAGLAPAAIEIRLGDGVRRVGLDDSAPHGTAGDPLLPRLAAAAAILALAAAAAPFVRQSLALAAAEREIEALEADARLAGALRQEIDRLTEASRLVEADRARKGSALLVLAAATRVLPDDSYLTDLTWRDGRVTLVGRSASAAALLRRVAETPPFRDPAFTGPVVRASGGDLESFALAAGVVPGGAATREARAP